MALVGLDVGTTGVKGVAIDEDGARARDGERGISALDAAAGLGRAGPGGLVARGRRRASAGCPRGRSASRGRCTGSSSSTPTSACFAQRSCGTTSAPPPSARRSRSGSASTGSIELTGNRALTGFTAPKLLWLRRHEPELYGRIRHVLLPKDYVRLRLTGEHAIDVADASGTLLFDVRRRAWSEEVCAALEIPLEWLPPAHESTEIAGAGDQAAAALGVGIARPGPVSVVLGTSGVVFAALPAYEPDRAGARCTRSATPSPARGTRWG